MKTKSKICPVCNTEKPTYLFNKGLKKEIAKQYYSITNCLKCEAVLLDKKQVKLAKQEYQNLKDWVNYIDKNGASFYDVFVTLITYYNTYFNADNFSRLKAGEQIKSMWDRLYRLATENIYE